MALDLGMGIQAGCSAEDHWENFDRDCIDSMVIFTMLILPVNEHGRSSYLLKSSSISLFSGLQFSLKKSLVHFVKFILRYFIVFEAIVNGIVSLISFSVCVLLLYRKATDSCMLIFYPATLPKEFMISSRFFW
jgi:hypothetical protein